MNKFVSKKIRKFRDQDWNIQLMKILNQIYEELNIAKICLDSIEESKTHGVRNIIKAKSRILKLLWLFMVSLLASTGYCIYEMAISVLAYLQYNVV